MKFKKVIIHAGLHKTGTSSIQHACKASSESLLNQGILYPNFGSKQWANHSVPLSLMFMDDNGKRNHTLNSMFGSDYERINAAENVRNSIILELSQTQFHTVLISGEDLAMFTRLNLEVLKTFFIHHGFYELEIIIYVRNPINYLLSNAQEIVRAGIYSLGTALKLGNLQQVKNKVMNFIEVFGENDVSVYCYDNSIVDSKDIVKDFTKKLGVVGVFNDVDKLRVNSSMSLEKALVLSAVKEYSQLSIHEFIGILPDYGSPIIGENSLIEFMWVESETDRLFLKEKLGINYIKPSLNLKPIIDFKLLNDHIQIVKSKDSVLEHKIIIQNIIADIKEILPELALLIEESIG